MNRTALLFLRILGTKIIETCEQIASMHYHKSKAIREATEIQTIGTFNKKENALNLPAVWKTNLCKKNQNTSQPETNTLKTDRGQPRHAHTTPSQQNTSRHTYNLRQQIIRHILTKIATLIDHSGSQWARNFQRPYQSLQASNKVPAFPITV